MAMYVHCHHSAVEGLDALSPSLTPWDACFVMYLCDDDQDIKTTHIRIHLVPYMSHLSPIARKKSTLNLLAIPRFSQHSLTSGFNIKLILCVLLVNAIKSDRSLC